MNNKGFTIPEAILGTIIMVVSLFGLLRAYTFSTGYVEKVGIKRQGLAVMQQEYERVKRYSRNGEFDLSPLIINDKEVYFYSKYNQKERSVAGFLSTEIEEKKDESGLNCYFVNISIRYEYEEIADTLTLPARIYSDKQ